MTTMIQDQNSIRHRLLYSPALFHAHYLKSVCPTTLNTIIPYPIQQTTQIHSNKVSNLPVKEPCDGIFTSETNTPLLIKHADCQAAIFWDPKQKNLAVIHAGWRGLVGEIYSETVKVFKAHASFPSDILVGISPSLGPSHAEFKGWKDYFPAHYENFQIKENYFDLRLAARHELEREGILSTNISICDYCTKENESEFHSWRRDKTPLRLATVAYIKNSL